MSTDAIRTQCVGDLPWPVLQQCIEHQVFSMTDPDILQAMRVTFEHLKLVVEPTGAIGDISTALTYQLDKNDTMFD